MKTNILFLFTLILGLSYCFGQKAPREIPNLLYVDEASVAVDSLQRLNLILPAKAEKAPLFIWIGGGAWSYVDRHKEMDLGRKFAEAGIAFASVGHRLSSAVWANPKLATGVQHPTHVKDLAQACRWLHDHADEYGYSREKFFIGGYSSGAHLAALITMDSRYLKEVALSPELFKGVVPIAWAYDIVAYRQVFLDSPNQKALAEQHVEAVFGETEQQLKQASPTEYVASLTTPMLLISERDTYNYTKLLEDKIGESKPSDFQTIHVRDMGHSQLWKHLSNEEESEYRSSMIRFMRERSGGGKG